MAGKSTYADLVKKNVASSSPEPTEDQEQVNETQAIEVKTKASKPPKPGKKGGKLKSPEVNGHDSSSKSATPDPVVKESVPEPAPVAEVEAEEPEDDTGFILIKSRERKQSTSSRKSGFRNLSGRPNSNRRNFKKDSDTMSEFGKKKSFDEKRDEEKLKYLNRFAKKDTLSFKVKNGDVLSADSNVSLAHCVSEDFDARDGVTKEFRDRFGQVDKLIAQNVKTGGCAHLESGDRFLFYLVTRNFSYHRPYYSSLEKSLKELRKKCIALEVTQLAMPLIGNRQDQLDWDLVSRILDSVFSGTDIDLTVYKYKSQRSKPPHTPRSRSKRVEE